jgi:hypothetical protein
LESEAIAPLPLLSGFKLLLWLIAFEAPGKPETKEKTINTKWNNLFTTLQTSIFLKIKLHLMPDRKY